MTSTTKFLMCAALLIGLSSCGVNRSWMLNQNLNTTQVQLAHKNYKHLGKVKGTSEVGYVLIFGGAKKKSLYNAAYQDMLDNAELTGAKSLTHILTEEHIGGVPPFFYKRTVTISAQLIEFSE